MWGTPGVAPQPPRFLHSTHLLKYLHWPSTQRRIIFKICTDTYQALSSIQPAYTHSLLAPARKPEQISDPKFSVAGSVRLPPGNVVSAFNIFLVSLESQSFRFAYPPKHHSEFIHASMGQFCNVFN